MTVALRNEEAIEQGCQQFLERNIEIMLALISACSSAKLPIEQFEYRQPQVLKYTRIVARQARRLLATDVITQYAIYAHPADYPDHYVVRAWYVIGGQVLACPLARRAGTLDEARQHVPPGVSNIGRNGDDDPVLREVWI